MSMNQKGSYNSKIDRFCHGEFGYPSENFDGIWWETFFRFSI